VLPYRGVSLALNPLLLAVNPSGYFFFVNFVRPVTRNTSNETRHIATNAALPIPALPDKQQQNHTNARPVHTGPKAQFVGYHSETGCYPDWHNYWFGRNMRAIYCVIFWLALLSLIVILAIPVVSGPIRFDDYLLKYSDKWNVKIIDAPDFRFGGSDDELKKSLLNYLRYHRSQDISIPEYVGTTSLFLTLVFSFVGWRREVYHEKCRT